MRVQSALLPLLLAPLPALAAAFDGAELSLLWGIPFAMVLLSIAIGPLLMPRMWHHYFGTITAFWTLLFLVPLVAIYGFSAGVETVVHALVEEYIPFILLLLALYTISGGILVWGNLHGSARLNTTILAIGTVLASFMGTTGAAMLLGLALFDHWPDLPTAAGMLVIGAASLSQAVQRPQRSRKADHDA